MDLVPKHLIIGIYTPTPGTPGTQSLTLEKINQIWMEVTSTYDYRVLRVAPDRTAGVFEGASEHDGVTIQPPCSRSGRTST